MVKFYDRWVDRIFEKIMKLHTGEFYEHSDKTIHKSRVKCKTCGHNRYIKEAVMEDWEGVITTLRGTQCFNSKCKEVGALHISQGIKYVQQERRKEWN